MSEETSWQRHEEILRSFYKYLCYSQTSAMSDQYRGWCEFPECPWTASGSEDTIEDAAWEHAKSHCDAPVSEADRGSQGQRQPLDPGEMVRMLAESIVEDPRVPVNEIWFETEEGRTVLRLDEGAPGE